MIVIWQKIQELIHDFGYAGVLCFIENSRGDKLLVIFVIVMRYLLSPFKQQWARNLCKKIDNQKSMSWANTVRRYTRQN